MNWKIPYFELQLGEEERQAAVDVINSNWLTSGPKIQEFENLFSENFHNSLVQSLAVANCTVGLHLAVKVLGIGKDDEVICPSLTFVATSNSILYCGAKPVFADITSLDNWNLSVEDVKKKITKKTKAILPVHYGGYACDMNAIMEIAREHNLKVIEDVSHAPFVSYNSETLGAIGDIGCFSFFSNKNMTTGEGGMVVTKDKELYKKLKNLRSHGMTTSSYERFKGHAFGYDVTDIGFNYRMDEIRAAIGIVQLKKLEKFQKERLRISILYKSLLKQKLPEIEYPFQNYQGESGNHIFPILIPIGLDREKVMSALSERGIQTSIHYRPVHTFTAYKEYSQSLPLIESIMGRILSLPFYPSLKDDDVQYVVDSLKASI